jgi:hypothetical protein
LSCNPRAKMNKDGARVMILSLPAPPFIRFDGAPRLPGPPLDHPWSAGEPQQQPGVSGFRAEMSRLVMYSAGEDPSGSDSAIFRYSGSCVSSIPAT